MLVLGVDPGETTGVCLMDTDTVEVKFRDEIPGGLKGMVDAFGLDPWEMYPQVGMVVMEDFILDGRTPKPNITPLLIKGWFMATAQANGHSRKFRIQRNVSKSLATNDVLKRGGLYPPRGQVRGGHNVDALRHIIAYCAKSGQTKVIEHLFPKDVD